MVVILVKASVYAGFSVVIWLVVWCIYTDIRSFSDNFSYLVCKCPLLFLYFFGFFFFSSLVKWGILGVWKDKFREKDKGKGRGRCEGSRIFLWDGGEGFFGIFLVLFWRVWKSVQRKLNFDNQKKLLLP